MIVRFVKGEAEWQIEVEAGATLLEAAHACEAPVQTLCHGIGACVQCRVRIMEGEANLTAPTNLEKDRLGNIFHLTHERLSCQTQVQGAVTVEVQEIKLPKKKRRTYGPRGRR